MKTIPLALLDAYAKPGTSTCFLVKLVTKKNEVLGFATADRNVRFDDGAGFVTYKAYQELRPQKFQEDSTFDVDNTELLGWFSQAVENMVVTGQFDFAELTVYRVNYLRLDRGAEVMAYGTVGEVSFSKSTNGNRKVEFRSLLQQLKQTVNQLYSLTCRADFGDARCGMPLAWETATVSAVGSDPYADITLSGLVRADGYFDLGVLEVLSGPNAGAEIEVESWLSSGVVRLTFLAPFAFVGGESVRIRRDCNKTATACIAYGNIARMRAEHMTPVQDQGVMVPGAYIRSSGAL